MAHRWNIWTRCRCSSHDSWSTGESDPVAVRIQDKSGVAPKTVRQNGTFRSPLSGCWKRAPITVLGGNSPVDWNNHQVQAFAHFKRRTHSGWHAAGA
jgi:hypothetical protein